MEMVTNIVVTKADNEGVTLPASLCGTFLQTLPDLVTPLKEHSLSPRSCPATRSAPPKGSGTNMTVEAT